MTRMTRPDCAVMYNLIKTHTHTHYYYIGFSLLGVPACMAINNVSVQFNRGLLSDIILLIYFSYHRGTCLNAMKRF